MKRRSPKLSTLLTFSLLFFLPSVAFTANETKLNVATIAYDTPFLDAQVGLKSGLRKFGYIEGKNINFITYDIKKDLSQIPELVKKLQRQRCDLIMTTTTPVTRTVKKGLETSAPIPVVFTMVADPLRAEIVPDMSNPGGDITGIAYNAFKIMPKKLELFREAFPDIKKLAIYYNHDEQWLTQPIKALLLPAAQKLDFEITDYNISNHTDFETMSTSFNRAIEGIFMVPDPLNISIFPDLVRLSRQEKIPIMVLDNSLLPKGGVIGYSPTFFSVGEQAAALVAKIFSGTPPGNLAIQTTKTIQLAVSVRESKKLQIDIPETFLQQCDYILR